MRLSCTTAFAPAWALAAAMAAATPAKAEFIGTDFAASYQYPALGSVYAFATWAPPTFTAGSGVETSGDVEGVTTIAVDFSSSTLALLLTTVLTSPTWTSAAFNGPVFTAATPLGISGVSVNSATTMAGFDSSRVTTTTDEIRIDWNGLSYVDGTTVVIDFMFAAVPAPSGLALLGMALLGLSAAARRRLPA